MVFIECHLLKPPGCNNFPRKEHPICLSDYPMSLSEFIFSRKTLKRRSRVQWPPSFVLTFCLTDVIHSDDLVWSNVCISRPFLLSRLFSVEKEKFTTCMHLKHFLYINAHLVFSPPSSGLLLFLLSPQVWAFLIWNSWDEKCIIWQPISILEHFHVRSEIFQRRDPSLNIKLKFYMYLIHKGWR